MNKVRIGILASGSGSNFEAIATACQNPDYPGEIAVLICNRAPAYARERARARGIPEQLLANRDYAQREDHDRAIVAALQQHGVELVVMAGWMRVATPVLLAAYPDRILNIHPSLLPSFRGMHAVQQALDYGVKISGCTVHIVRLEVDSGPILAQAAVPVYPTDTVTSLQQRIQIEEHRIYPPTIAQYIQSGPPSPASSGPQTGPDLLP
ncbi:MAG: phosphoribosylglycinamide formyltransferase [Pseudanabaenaceae cyanobacterium]